MSLLIKLTVIVMAIVQGQITFNEPVRAPEPVVIVEDTAIVEEVWIDVQDETVYPDFRVVEMVDGQGVQALVPDLPATVSPKDSWALFWAMNPELKEQVNNQ